MKGVPQGAKDRVQSDTDKKQIPQGAKIVRTIGHTKQNLGYDEVHWVCITNKKQKFKYKRRNEYSWKWFMGDKQLILPARECLKVIPQKKITIHGNYTKVSNMRFHEFNVTFTSESIPTGYTIIQDRTAFFNGFNKSLPYRPYNFYHFLVQDFYALHYLIKSSDRLGIKQNDFFPNSPQGFCPGKFIPFDMSLSEHFLSMLGIQNIGESVFQDNAQPDRVCYENAVFNSKLHMDHALDAIEFIKGELKVKDHCEQNNMVTIVQRDAHRKILNIEELRQVTIEMGYNVQIVRFEKFSLAEQAQIIHCTDILVGTQGAALSWANFMRNNSGLIEIAWPSKGWHFYFTQNTGKILQCLIFDMSTYSQRGW